MCPRFFYNIYRYTIPYLVPGTRYLVRASSEASEHERCKTHTITVDSPNNTIPVVWTITAVYVQRYKRTSERSMGGGRRKTRTSTTYQYDLLHF